MFIFWCISFLTVQSIAWGGWAHQSPVYLWLVVLVKHFFFLRWLSITINIPINYFKTQEKKKEKKVKVSHCINVVDVWLSLVHIVVLSFPFSNL